MINEVVLQFKGYLWLKSADILVYEYLNIIINNKGGYEWLVPNSTVIF